MADITTVQRVPVPDSQAHITPDDDDVPEATPQSSLDKLSMFASANGDISDLLETSVLDELGVKAIREWLIDEGSRQSWKDKAERSLDIAAQERQEDDEREPLWDDGADIHYPVLTVASQQFNARALPELIKGDKVVGVKVFLPPPTQPSPIEAARAEVPNPNPQQAQGLAQGIQNADNQQAQQSAQDAAKNARAQRVAHYLNFVVFYRMDDWEGETDQLMTELSIVGSSFKKVYMGTTGLCSDYISALRLCVHNDTKSIHRCPRITQDFEIYPYEIEDNVRAGIYRAGFLDKLPPPTGEDKQKPYTFIEQHRLDDLDGDGLAEPYIVTVEKDSKAVARVEPAYTMDDVMIRGDKVSRIERWLPFSEFAFLPDPKGRFYKLGFGALLDDITNSIDAIVNQLLDAGTAEIAGGGFIAGGVKLQGSGTGGVVTFQPGEYVTANVNAGTLQESIWERTVPHPSAVSLKMFELLLAAAKDIVGVQDVLTGEAPSTAPVGTTVALQNQAMMVFSSIYKRIYRGFRDEFRLMYRAMKRWATDKERQEYQEVTGGNLDEDFAGDGTDIQPVADPSVIGKMQRMARNQALIQLAESPIGMAAGMTQAAPAQKIVTDFLTDMDYQNPKDYVADVPPNPELVAKTQDMAAAAQLKQAQAQTLPIKTQIEAHKMGVDASNVQAENTLLGAKTLREIGLAALDTHEMHKETDRIAQTGSVADAESLMDPAEEAEKDRKAKPKPSAK